VPPRNTIFVAQSLARAGVLGECDACLLLSIGFAETAWRTHALLRNNNQRIVQRTPAILHERPVKRDYFVVSRLRESCQVRVVPNLWRERLVLCQCPPRDFEVRRLNGESNARIAH
jgi:hypothetical protein